MTTEQLLSAQAELKDLLPQLEKYKYRFPRMITNILSEVENVQNVVELVDETVGIKYANVEKIIMVIRVFLEEQNEK